MKKTKKQKTLKMFQYILLFFSLSLGQNLWAQTEIQKNAYKCILDLIPEGANRNSEENQKFLSEFIYKENEDNKGIAHTNQGVEVKTWRRMGFLHLILTHKPSNLKVATAYKESQEKFDISMSPNIKLNCYYQTLLQSGPQSGGTQSVTMTLTPKSDLVDFGANITFTVNKDLTVYWKQQNVIGSMRPIIFQNGIQYTADGPYHLRSNFCTMSLEAKKKFNTRISRDSIFKPMSMSKHQNSENFYVVSYSFVDIDRGKKIYENPNYALMSIECNIKIKDTFNIELFNHITGKAISISK